MVTNQLNLKQNELDSHSLGLDFVELFDVLWRGKLIIFTLVVLMAVMAAIFATSQPKVYRANATFVVSSTFYDIEGIKEPELSSDFLASRSLKDIIASTAKIDKKDIAQLGLSFDIRSKIISASKSSQSPDDAFHTLVNVSNSLNQALKNSELDKVDVGLKAIDSVEQFGNLSNVENSLATIYSQLLYKKAILLSPKSKLIKIVTAPSKPHSHVKPKRALLIIGGAILGAIIGVAIVLIRFAFRKEQE